METKDPRVISAPTSPVLKLCAVSSFHWAVAGCCIKFWHSFFESWQKTRLISSPIVFPKILPDVLSFLRRSCSFKSRFLIPLLHSGCARRLFPEVRCFWVPRLCWSLEAVSLVRSRNGTAGKPSWGRGNFCPDPPMPWVRFLSIGGALRLDAGPSELRSSQQRPLL
jgi:hypothetical protein